jgi:hypothetical protein
MIYKAEDIISPGSVFFNKDYKKFKAVFRYSSITGDLIYDYYANIKARKFFEQEKVLLFEYEGIIYKSVMSNDGDFCVAVEVL